jgi:hypothetical protein
MIEMLLVAATTIQSNQLKKQNENYVIVEKRPTTSTVKDFNDFLSQIETKTQLATYQSVPLTSAHTEDDFISPVKKSIVVNATFILGGKISPLPMDDEIVYFDE